MTLSLRIAGSRLAALALGAVLLTACAGTPFPAQAQSGTGIPVLVMLEDADARSVVRTSNISKRVMAELKRSMQNEGYRMVDEEMIAADLGWKITARRPRVELVQAMNLANQSGNAAHHVRAQAVFSIFAIREQLSFANRIQVRVDGELYDALSRQFIGAWEMPRQTYPAPAECNDACLSEIVGDKARDIAVSVGGVLARQLAAIAPVPPRAAAPAPTPVATQPTAPVTGTPRADGRCGPMMTSYSLNFRRFANSEVLQILNVMTAGGNAGFPCFANYDTMSGTGSVQNYSYVSTATTAKLREWLSIVLMDMGLNPDRQVEILVSGNQITLDKVVPNAGGSRTAPGAGRFQ